MPHRKWDLVFITQFPNQEDATQYTKRPAVILEVLGNKLRVCPISKQTHQSKNYNSTILVELNTPEATQMNLNFESIIILDRIVEIDSSKAPYPAFGRCHSNIIAQIKSYLSE